MADAEGGIIPCNSARSQVFRVAAELLRSRERRSAEPMSTFCKLPGRRLVCLGVKWTRRDIVEEPEEPRR